MRSRYYFTYYEHARQKEFADSYLTMYDKDIDDVHLAFANRERIRSFHNYDMRRFMIKHEGWKSLIVSGTRERRTYAI